MAKKEFKIGEIFQCGLVKLKCENEKNAAIVSFILFVQLMLTKLQVVVHIQSEMIKQMLFS